MKSSLNQQAQRDITNMRETTRPEIYSRNTDLMLPDDDEEEDQAPPAYGEIYGEIRNERDGMGTNARLTDDGRVDIRINHLSRRLSQVFNPALRQQITKDQDSPPPPPLATLPPPLNIVIQVVGSRGDVQPFVALGKVLKETYGHRVRLATHGNFRDFVTEHGLEFFNIGGDPARLMAFMVKNPGLVPGFRSVASGDVSRQRENVGEYIQGCWRSCYEAGDGIATSFDDLSGRPESDTTPFVADCIIANPPSFAHVHCAEKLGIPLHMMFTMPYSPTQAFPHPLANIRSTNTDPQLTNFISYAMIELLSWQGLGDIINRFRKKCLGLDPVSIQWAPGMLQRLQISHTYCWSPALLPKPKDWAHHISISGFYFLKSSEYTPSPELQAFLDAGPKPVYIGFGSIVLDDPDALTKLIFEAVAKTGQRVLLSKGWGGMGVDDTPEGVFMLGNVPHDWLFKHVSCVVHHGGAGTTAAGIAAGRPTIIVPFFGDQPFWGGIVARAGAGPDPIPIKQLTASRLADAITFCLRPDSLEHATRLASKIAAERPGSEVGAESFHQFLEPDKLRCTLAPGRSAVWRIKRTKIRLSAFAACTLANANLLEFHDLKLFRAQEYYTDEGPRDPISGGFTAACRAFSGMGMGIVESPSETFKALRPSSYRQKSLASTSMSTGSNSDLSRRPVSTRTESLPVERNSNEPAPFGGGQNRRRLSKASSSSSRITRSSTSTSSPGPSNTAASDTSSHRVRSRVEHAPGKDRDMLRPAGPHTSRGVGRSTRALAQGPGDIAAALTKGSHNLPKLWGDDTVRPQEQVSDFRSGLTAVGREFGLGWYDGVTGLVTQPWNGAQKEGVGGFVKGIGKGMAGFIAKPLAGTVGVLGHSMRGVHKEAQKAFGSNVQSHIVASRAAQGYEEWLNSSEAEKQDVIDRWRLIRKHLKKRNHDEVLKDVLSAQRPTTAERAPRGESADAASLTESPDGADALTLDSESLMRDVATARSSLSSIDTIRNSEDTLDAAETNRPHPSQDPQTSGADAQDNTELLRQIQSLVSQLQNQRQEPRNQTMSHKASLQADSTFERRGESSQHIPRGPQHLAGTTQQDFEAQQQQSSHREKSTEEKSEEQIVLEYVKKQSLLEGQHQKSNKGKGRAGVDHDLDDQDLQLAMRLSLQGNAAKYGAASSMH